jgi:hypothetical protein
MGKEFEEFKEFRVRRITKTQAEVNREGDMKSPRASCRGSLNSLYSLYSLNSLFTVSTQAAAPL